MTRPYNPGIHTRLREQAVDYVLSRGIVDLALRPLAKALKTSARMLMYHFGSREQLMHEILLSLRQREDAHIRAWFKENKEPTLPEFLRWYWRRMASPRARPAARLIFELYALALRDPQRYPGVLTDPLAYWQKLASGTSRQKNADEATLLLAATRGLLLDLCATGEDARVQRAMALLADLLDRSPRSRKKIRAGIKSAR